jgi:osmotically-inducible protein OsmY
MNERQVVMKRFESLFAVLTAGMLLTGCSGAFWGGAGGGTAGTAAGYELRARQQMETIDREFKAGQIDQREYDIRKDQIKKMSLAY